VPRLDESAPAVLPDDAPRPPLGPADREHFLDAQRRNRRASWRASLFAPIAVLLAGVPLCVIVTPALFAPLLAAGYVLHAVGVLPAGVWSWLHDAAHLLPTAWNAVRGRGAAPSWEMLALLLVVPGAVVMVAAWVAIRLALRRTWYGRALGRLHARRPVLTRPVERQLVNAVEEVAVAAGVRPPRVLVAEVPSANALLLGNGPDDATVVVTRGMLEALGRDELQAVAAWAVASAGNGDLGVAATLMSVFHAWGVLGLLTDAPHTPSGRAAVRFVARTLAEGVRDAVRGRAPERAERADRRRAADMLLKRAGLEGSAFATDAVVGADHDRHPIFYGCLVQLPLLLSLGLASITLRVALELGATLVLGPVIAWLWRTRRYLADAAAVELTRHPAALAEAARRLAGPPGVTPEAAALSFLCFVRATRTPQSVHDTPDAPYVTNLPVGMLPDPEDRLARLSALGGEAAPLAEQARTPPNRPGELRLVLLYGVVAVGLAALLMLVNFATTGALLYGIWAVLTFVFATVPGRIAALLRA
jgi:Zn-dependent protease with chaperone function